MPTTIDGTTIGGHMVPRHVWVAPDGRWQDKRPAIAWDRRRNEDGGWEYLVAWVLGGGNIAPSMRSGWVSAALVRTLDEVKS